MSNEIKAGQQLWFVPNRSVAHGGPRFITVTSVGRKWIWFGKSRANRDTLRVDGKGYMSPGTCYVTKDEWVSECRRRQAWDKLRDAVKAYSPPDEISTEKIETAIRILTGEVAILTPLSSGKD